MAKQAGRASDEYLRLYSLEGFLLRLATSVSSQDTHAAVIRDEDQYSGLRVTLGVELSTAHKRFHVDVNVGDPIWPSPAVVEFPLLGGNIRLLGYPIPMVLAEKIVTASQRGITSTRWRDFADLYLLAGQHRLVADDGRTAIIEVATHRNAEMGSLRPVLDGYPALAQTKWHAWRARQNLEDRLPADFAEVLESVLAFTDGLLDATRTSQAGIWSPADRTWS